MIVVICMALNEERNIKNFCTGYDFADMILIADSSTDKTREIALQFDNVQIIDTNHLKTIRDGIELTPEYEQTEILINQAKKIGASWIIRDDCDSWPNPHLKKDARLIIDNTSHTAIFAYHLYIYGTDKYFPKMNEPGRFLWAWKPAKVDIKAADPTGYKNVPSIGERLDFPYALLHYFAPDEETIQAKMARKVAAGRGKQTHILESIYAPPELLPDWAL